MKNNGKLLKYTFEIIRKLFRDTSIHNFFVFNLPFKKRKL